MTLILTLQFQDGTIGDDIVVKPLSAQVRQVLNTRRMSAEEDNMTNGGGGGEDESGILADYVRSLRDMEELRPRHGQLVFPIYIFRSDIDPGCDMTKGQTILVPQNAVIQISHLKVSHTLYCSDFAKNMNFMLHIFGRLGFLLLHYVLNLVQ